MRAAWTVAVRLARIVLVMIIVVAMGIALVLGAVIVLGPRQDAQPSDAVVVLGAAVWPGGKPSPALYARTARGVELVKAGIAPVLVVTGGLGWNPPAEAVVMRQTARELGVPADRIIVEDQAHSTADSAEFVGAIARRHGWQRVVVVTDPFHTLRTRWLFRAQGLEVSQAPTNDTYYSESTRLRYQWRETLAIGATLFGVRGWVLDVGCQILDVRC